MWRGVCEPWPVPRFFCFCFCSGFAFCFGSVEWPVLNVKCHKNKVLSEQNRFWLMSTNLMYCIKTIQKHLRHLPICRQTTLHSRVLSCWFCCAASPVRRDLNHLIPTQPVLDLGRFGLHLEGRIHFQRMFIWMINKAVVNNSKGTTAVYFKFLFIKTKCSISQLKTTFTMF